MAFHFSFYLARSLYFYVKTVHLPSQCVELCQNSHLVHKLYKKVIQLGIQGETGSWTTIINLVKLIQNLKRARHFFLNQLECLEMLFFFLSVSVCCLRWAPVKLSLPLCALQKMEEAAVRAATEEHRRMKTQLDLQDRFRVDLEREKMVISQHGTCLE